MYIPHIAFCFLSLLSCILTTCVLLLSSESIITHGGIGMVIFPNGPSISTVGVGLLRVTARPGFGGEGSRMVKVTSGGSESGMTPSFERR